VLQKRFYIEIYFILIAVLRGLFALLNALHVPFPSVLNLSVDAILNSQFIS
jgi:hypothetical protein